MSGHDELVTQVAAALPDWLPAQRWFGGKDREIDAVSPVSWTTLLEGDPLLVHLVVRVEQGERQDLYQLLIGSRQSELPNVPATASIGLEDGRTCYEASGDADLTACLLDFMVEGRSVGSMTFEREPGAELTTGLRGHPITSEQSNTSLVYGHHHILKLFRKLGHGVNKDLVLHRALYELGSQQIAEPQGSISARIDDEDVTIGMLQRFLPDAADGWVMATTSVRDFMADPTGLPPEELGGDFAGEAYRLGKAVAAVHADLARALGTEQAGDDDVRRTLDSMLERLDRVSGQVPELERHADAARSMLQQGVEAVGPVATQSIHGDLHLGQVLRTVHGWLLLDFEGEPAASVAERSALASALRDVAGMLRSFDYAAQQLLVGQPDDPNETARAMSWARRNREAFCDGYGKVAGEDPRERAGLLRALELDKAIYEVAYEHANRPDWLTVPIASIERILSEGE